MSRIRFFFITDLHGCTTCFKKAIRFIQQYKINHLIVGGDIAGKIVIPVVKKNGEYTVSMEGIVNYSSNNLTKVIDKIKPLVNNGYYYAVLEEGEYLEIKSNKEKMEELFKEKILEKLNEWIEFAEKEAKKQNAKLYFMPGNDDPDYVEEFLESKRSENIIPAETRIVTLEDNLQMLSCGYSNPTPWNLPRDIPEEKLESILFNLANELDDPRKSIFNIHPPPYNTNIDLAPKLDENMRPILQPGGGYEMINVGSKAVRKLIEEFQPITSLHGHIHESRGFHKIGKTLALNPGSEYQEGILRGAVVVVEPQKSKVLDFILLQV